MNKLVRMLSAVFLLALISAASVLAVFLAEGKVDTGRRYNLSLVAKQLFSTVVLTAHLALSEGHHKKGDVAGAVIHFFICKPFGCNLREIGHNITRHDGTASFQWSAPENGDYWFVANYVVAH